MWLWWGEEGEEDKQGEEDEDDEVMIPMENLTDVTLAIEDTDWWIFRKSENVPKILEFSENLRIFRKSENDDNDDNGDNDDNDESYQVMEVIKWWKLSSDESYLVMKVI